MHADFLTQHAKSLCKYSNDNVLPRLLGSKEKRNLPDIQVPVEKLAGLTNQQGNSSEVQLMSVTLNSWDNDTPR
jgi:hypothetical protein